MELIAWHRSLQQFSPGIFDVIALFSITRCTENMMINRELIFFCDVEFDALPFPSLKN